MIKVKYIGTDEFYNVNLLRNDNLMSLSGDIPFMPNGFDTYSLDGKMLGHFPEFTTLYRQFELGIVLSNDGSQWVEPTQEITLSVEWDDKTDRSLRPDSVDITYNIAGVSKVITFSDENNWKETYTISQDDSIIIEYVPDVEHYKMLIGQYDVTYLLEEGGYEPDLEQRISDLEIAICEISEIIGQLE